MKRLLRKIIDFLQVADSPYDKSGGKPDFVKELEDQNITGFEKMYNHLMNNKDKK